LWEENKPGVVDNEVPRTIFGPKKDKVIRQWRSQHNEELYALYSSPNIIEVNNSRRMECAGHVAYMEEEIRGAYRVLVGKPEGRWSPERIWCKWKNNIKTDI
jgi:hypothetical protein